MDEKQDFAQRLQAAMRAAGHPVRPSVLEREFNLRYWGRPVTFQGVSRWLKGRSIPEQDKLQVLAQWLSVDPQTLRFGTPSAPDPFLQPEFWPPTFARATVVDAPQKEQEAMPINFARTTRPQLSNDEWKMIEQWQSLPKPTQQAIAALIKALAAATQ